MRGPKEDGPLLWLRLVGAQAVVDDLSDAGDPDPSALDQVGWQRRGLPAPQHVNTRARCPQLDVAHDGGRREDARRASCPALAPCRALYLIDAQQILFGVRNQNSIDGIYSLLGLEW
eukprot:346940-Pyramimonas_sp.AAC.1